VEDKKCKNCDVWVKDQGVWCFNGWSGSDRDDGYCHFYPKKIYKRGNDFCLNFVSKQIRAGEGVSSNAVL
jgi:hypothetical protein